MSPPLKRAGDTKMHEFRELKSQTDLVGTQNTYLCKLHFIKQLNEGVKSQVPYIAYDLIRV